MNLLELEVTRRVRRVLRAAISSEVKYRFFVYTDCDKQVIAGIINSSSPVKVEIYSHSRSVSFFFHKSTNGKWLLTHFLHPQIKQFARRKTKFSCQ